MQQEIQKDSRKFTDGFKTLYVYSNKVMIDDFGIFCCQSKDSVMLISNKENEHLRSTHFNNPNGAPSIFGGEAIMAVQILKNEYRING